MSLSLSILYYFCIAAFICELAAFYSRTTLSLKRILAAVAVVGALLSVYMIFALPFWWTLLAIVVLLFRLINISRIFKGRMHGAYLRSAGLRSAVMLAWMYIFVLVLGIAAANNLPISYPVARSVFVVVAIMNTLTVIVLLLSLYRTVVKTKRIPATTHLSDDQLPPVSILVPARNETEDLQQCLTSLLASDYPKLEIIVYDDCSQSKTSDIIKSFAHKGVRFIVGTEPGDSWLAKNLAYERLYEESTGDIIMFCGVDTRYGPSAVRGLVTTMVSKNKQMMSVMPVRHYGAVDSAILQPMRYWWELVPPLRLFNRPPVLSTCWMIERKVMQSFGGFASLSRSIIPEHVIARNCVLGGLGYSFVRANKYIDVQTVKGLVDQRQTAIRTRYPLLKRRPENVLLLLMAEVFVFVLPLLVFIVGVMSGSTLLSISGGVSLFILTIMHVWVVKLSSPGLTLISIFNLPVVLLAEFVVVIYSMLKYEFGTVVWKERNVCIPAMHVYPKLPKA